MLYGNHDFKPNGKLDHNKFKGKIYNLLLRSHTELKIWDDYFARAYQETAAVRYSHQKFYKAMQECEDDLFLCDNGKVYIPCEHELMEFLGYR